MQSQDLKKHKLPDTPGIYFFKKGREIFYIGKATSLRDRVKSYFSNDLIATRGPLIVDMVFKADKITFQKTDSILEALILEAELIKKHKPKYNTKEKDDKSYNFVIITKEDFPRVLIERGRSLDFPRRDLFADPRSLLDKSNMTSWKRFDLKSQKRSNLEEPVQRIFGPFPHSTQLKEAVKIVRKIFPFRDRCTPNQGEPCFNKQIGLCPGACDGSISKVDYKKIIKNIILFFEGKKTKIIKNLEKEMKALAKEQKFEKAGEIKKTIFALNHIQDVALLKAEDFSGKRFDLKSQERSNLEERKILRIEAYDIAHISGTANVGVMVVLEDGEPAKNGYRKFKIRESKQNDIAGLKEILERRLAHEEWAFPQIIVVDGGKAQIKVAREVVSRLLGYRIAKLEVVSVLKDERHRPKAILGDKTITSKYSNDILLANNEAHRFAIKYHRKTLAKKSLV
ncbi:MAG: UvrB/UvrC motif-containing protein [Candidatus Paceibacterota bacterium]|jgi:excinuclease ABC subunit C